MPNIPGGQGLLPGAYSDVKTQSRGLNVPGGLRVAAIMGEGSTNETLISTAVGGGNDGLNSSYSSTTGADGRHFRLSQYPVISNRVTLYKNGIPLTGLEEAPDGYAFSYQYDYRIDIATGKIELQAGHILDQGGDGYVALSTNVGDGYIESLTLVDVNAQPETWTVRCVGVQRTSLNVPIMGTAKFVAIGSISGSKLDANGNPIIWQANNTTVSNGILSFSIGEISSFVEGDAFTIKVASGVLVKDDSLVANYIPEANLNDPEFLDSMNAVVQKHGIPSTTNNLSLGAQLAFANQAPGVMACQTYPPVPRRTSYILEDSVDAESTNDDDFIFPLPVGVVPNLDSDIHFFVTNPATEVEQQLLPNKWEYYTLDTGGANPTTNFFINDNTAAPAGYSYFYTVVSKDATIDTGFDGYIGRILSSTTLGVFSSGTEYDATYVGKQLKIIDATNKANINTYTITSVTNGDLHVTADAFTDFSSGSSISFQVIDVSTGLPLVGGSGSDGILTPNIGLATASFSSAAVDFGALSSILTRRVRITGTASQDGDYDITAAGGHVCTIKKTIVTESNMRYEVIDTSDTSTYIVCNRNIVPNGYQLRVTIVDARDASFYDAGWINALEAMELVDCDILVPLPKQTMSIIFQNALAHCKSMSNIRNRRERVLFTGAIAGLTPENLIGTEDAAVEDIGILEGIQGDSVTEVLAGNIEDLANYSVADAFGNTYRCVYFYPDEIVVQAGTDNVLVDGFYLAAAAAGYCAADIRVENPLTNKILTGFSILRNKLLSTLTMENLAAAGVTIVQPVTGGGRVIWGRTTTQSGYPEEEEISIIFIRDRIAKALRAGFSGFIGNVESSTTAVEMYARAVALLSSFTAANLITAYADLVVVRDSVDPRQWNVSVRVQPAYPINYIYIKVNVGQI